jgi:hypothetical protein
MNVVSNQLISKEIIITNTSNQVKRIYFEISDFFLDEEGNPVYNSIEDDRFSCKDWISLQKRYVDVVGNSKESLKITIAVPHSVHESRFAAIMLKCNGFEETISTNFMVSNVLACPIIIQPKLISHPQISILDSEINHRAFWCILKNESNYYTRIKGLAYLYFDNKGIKKMTFTENWELMFPQTFQRFFVFSIDNEDINFIKRVIIEINIKTNKHRLHRIRKTINTFKIMREP